MSAPAVSRAVEASDGVTAVCPSGPNASCCQAEQSSNEDLPSHPGSREAVLPGSASQLREFNLPRFKVERRSNGVPAPQTNPSEQFQPGSAPHFREPNARRAERSSSITHRTLDRHSHGEEQHHHSRHQYSKAYSPGSAVTAAFSHDSGIQMSPNGMHYSEAAPGGDGRPNCKCGCDCGTFLDTLIRAIEDRVRGAVPLVDAEANGDAAAMNRFIREILSPLDNPLLLPISGERGRQRQGSESAGSHSHGSESYDAGDDVRFELDDPSGLDDPIDTGASSFAAGIGVPAAASCCAPRPDPGRAQKTPLARAAPAGRSCCSSLVPTLYAPSQASCCAGGGEVAGSSSNGKVANNGQCCSSGDGGSGSDKPCNCSCRKRKRTWQPGDPEHPEIDSDGALACNCGCHKPYQECTDCLDDQCEQTLFGAP
ncbi:hypothetical protein GGF42_007085 [Coemansia sp. RSA 2424]|nr:hypothetical protein GGF42_007085 [Coemansia sp. RSA 2424]